MPRDQFVGLKFTQKEYDYIKEKAAEDSDTCWKNGNKNISAYIRKCVLQDSEYELGRYIRKEIKNVVYQIRKIGVNINQAVKRINANVYDIETTEQLFDSLENIYAIMKELEEKLEQADGCYKIDEH